MASRNPNRLEPSEPLLSDGQILRIEQHLERAAAEGQHFVISPDVMLRLCRNLRFVKSVLNDCRADIDRRIVQHMQCEAMVHELQTLVGRMEKEREVRYGRTQRAMGDV